MFPACRKAAGSCGNTGLGAIGEWEMRSFDEVVGGAVGTGVS